MSAIKKEKDSDLPLSELKNKNQKIKNNIGVSSPSAICKKVTKVTKNNLSIILPVTAGTAAAAAVATGTAAIVIPIMAVAGTAAIAGKNLEVKAKEIKLKAKSKKEMKENQSENLINEKKPLITVDENNNEFNNNAVNTLAENINASSADTILVTKL